MHAILVTIGTDGDVFPYVGLGAGGRDEGCGPIEMNAKAGSRFLANHSRPLFISYS